MIYTYTPRTDAYAVHHAALPDDTVTHATIDGAVYVSCPTDAPTAGDGVPVSAVTLTDDLRAALLRLSPHVALAQQRAADGAVIQTTDGPVTCNAAWLADQIAGWGLALSLLDQRAQLVRRIDADVDAVYAAVLGNRQAEYAEAEREAQEYANAGYTGTVPASVASWAAASGMTAQAASDNILMTAASWRGAAQSMRAARLAHKAQAAAAADTAAMEAVRASWAATFGAIRSALGLPG